MATPDTDWKNKYLNVLDDLEKAQQLEKRRIEVLRKGVVRVSVAADGQDDALDAHLADLRAAMRSQREVLEIEPLIFQLEQTVKSLDYRRKKDNDDVGTLMAAQLERYLALNLSRNEKRVIKKYRKEYPELLQIKGSQAELWKGYTEVTDSIIEHFKQQLVDAGVQAPKSFLQRLFGSKEQAESETARAAPDQIQEKEDDIDDDEPDNGEVQGNSSQRLLIPLVETAIPPDPEALFADAEMNLAESPDAVGAAGEHREEIKARIRRILQQLLEQIEIPIDLHPRKNKLLEQVQGDYEWEELPDILAETSQLVASIRVVSQKEFEGFLVTLHQRLQNIQDFLLTARRGEEESIKHQEKLDSDVRGELHSIRESVNSDRGIPQMRQDIEFMVGRILSALDGFREQENTRRDEVFQHMADMVERMHAMEQEASDLKQSLESQREKALRDALTGLPNRQAYDEQMAREFSRWRRHGHPLSVAVVDVDFFKRINDTLGHLRGDKVLKLVAREVQRRIRNEDFVARYGGEEFVVVMPDTDEQSAFIAMDKVRQSVVECPFNFNNERVGITVSIGVSGFKADDTPEACFERADQALYKAKNGGRNRVERLD